jgi:membrane dipeptidase
MTAEHILVDSTQYSNWSGRHFAEMHDAGMAAVCATICYHENFRETVANICAWNRRFEDHARYIMPCRSGADILAARAQGRTAILFALQNCSAIEDDIGLVAILRDLGVGIMQLSYNNQSLLATGCYEKADSGITRFGAQVIAEMNRVGMIVDMSHSGERSTREAIEISERPIAITHANPSDWHPSKRNKSRDLISRIALSRGMLGLSLYPHHLRDGTACTLASFCRMVAETAEVHGVSCLGIGSDLCQDQPDSVVEWMRNGRWSRERDLGEGSLGCPGFPQQPSWFRSTRDFPALADGLAAHGFSEAEANAILGGNWFRFLSEGLRPQQSVGTASARMRVAT